jgi:hypothetical protein
MAALNIKIIIVSAIIVTFLGFLTRHDVEE